MSTKRWIDSERVEDELEREVLRAGLVVEPPESAERDVWRRVAAVVAAPTPPTGGLEAAPAAASTGALTSGTATLGLLAKGFALGVGASAIVAVASRGLERPASPRPPAAATSAAVGARSAEPVERLVAPKVPEVASADPPDESAPAPRSTPSSGPRARAGTPAPRSVATSSAAGTESRESRLAAEAALLQKARAELRAGAIGAAFATLEASRQTISAPELDQEREALAVELLYRSGQRGPASARARAFIERYPESPHVNRVRSFFRVP